MLKVGDKQVRYITVNGNLVKSCKVDDNVLVSTGSSIDLKGYWYNVSYSTGGSGAKVTYLSNSKIRVDFQENRGYFKIISKPFLKVRFKITYGIGGPAIYLYDDKSSTNLLQLPNYQECTMETNTDNNALYIHTVGNNGEEIEEHYVNCIPCLKLEAPEQYHWFEIEMLEGNFIEGY